MSSAVRSEGDFVAQFIEAHCRITQGPHAGELVELMQWQKDLLVDLFALDPDGRRRYRRAYVQVSRKNGKTFLMAATALYEALFGEIGGEVYFVAGDRQQASRAFGEVRKIVEADAELRGLFRFFRHSAEVPSTGTVLRVLSADAGHQLGLSPSFVVFDEVAIQPNDRLWNAMSLGSGARAQPMLIGISTPGWEKDSLAWRLYQHGKAIEAGEVSDPTFFFRAWEPADPEADFTDPTVWAEANPSLGAFLHEADFAAAIGSTEEHEFRRFRLGQWTSTRSAAFPAGAWDAISSERAVPDGTSVVVAFVAARQRDCVALVGCTIKDSYIFPISVWEASERVDPSDVAVTIRDIFGRYDVRELVCQEHDWTWVLLQLEGEDLPVVRMPLSPQRSSRAWQAFFDGVAERRVSQSGDPVLARHVGNLSLIASPHGLRPDLEVSSAGAFVNAAVAAMIAYERASTPQEQEPDMAPPTFQWL